MGNSIDEPDWSRVAPYLDRALDLEPLEQEKWLAELTTRHPDIAQSVRRMLAERDLLNAKGFLQRSPLPAIAAKSRAGLSVGAYVVTRIIGRGGMGEVWLAKRNDGRYEGECAIKFLDASFSSSNLVERFRREGHLLAKLAHPNIARLLDAGAADDAPYLALEYIDGRRIDCYCDEKQLGVRERVQLFAEVVAAVAHAHSQLIIHRDLKPSNVLVTSQGHAKLLDFGIAKLLSIDNDGVDDAVTRIEDAVLTPEYAAPEQLLGEAPSTATDVYQLGLLLYVLLAGIHPLKQLGTRAEKIRAALDGSIPLASELAAAPLRRHLRGDLDAILSMALRKIPAERYATAQTFYDELMRYLHNEPVAARRGAGWYRARKFVTRHRAGVGATAVAGIALIASTVGVAIAGRNAAIERDRAIKELTYAEASNEFMTFLLSEGADQPFTTAALLDRAAQSVDKQFADDANVRARLQLVIANQYLDIRDFKKAQAVLIRAQASARAGNDPSLNSQIDCYLGAAYDAVGKTEEARALFDAGTRRLQSTTQIDPSAAVSCHGLLAVFHRDQGDAKNAIASAIAAKEQLKAPRPGQRATAVDLNQIIADAYAMSGRRAEAIATYEASLRDLKQMGRENTAMTLVLSINYAVHLSRAGQTLRAANVYQNTLDSEAANGRIANRYLEANYASVLVPLGKYEHAAALVERARAAAIAAGNARAIANSYLVGATLYCLWGQLPRCESELAHARETLPAVFPSTHKNFALLEFAAANSMLVRGDLAAAREQLRHALQLFDALAEKDSLRIRSQTLLARIELQLGDRNAALERANQAVADARAISQGFANSEWPGIALLTQGLVQKELGAKSEAQSSLSDALTQLQGSMGDDAPQTIEARTLLAAL